MIDLKKVRDDVQAYKLICEKRHMNIDVDAVLALDDQRKALQLEVDQTKAQQKQLAAQKDYEWAKNLKTKIQELENKHWEIAKELESKLLKIKMIVKMLLLKHIEKFLILIFNHWIILNLWRNMIWLISKDE